MSVFWYWTLFSPRGLSWDCLNILPSVMKDNKILITTIPPLEQGRRVSSWSFTVPASPLSGGSWSCTASCWGASASSSHLPGSASTCTCSVWPVCQSSGSRGEHKNNPLSGFACIKVIKSITPAVYLGKNMFVFWQFLFLMYFGLVLKYKIGLFVKEQDKLILFLIEYLRFWCGESPVKFRNMLMN